MSTKQYRYDFARGPWKKRKGPCPLCQKPYGLTFFEDTRTRERLPDFIAVCEKPGCYSHKPYDMQPNGMTYAEEVYQKGKEEARNNPAYRALPPRLPAPVKPIATIPAEVMEQSQRCFKQNVFVQLLRQTFGWGVADELVKTFSIGSSSHWPGSTVFFLPDEQGRIRGGQVVKFEEDGHREYTRDANGKKKDPKLTWVQHAYRAKCRKSGQPEPDWLRDYLDAGVSSPCLFGLAQLAAADPTTPCAIVESPKTMVIGAGFMPEYLWLATGSLGQLTRERLPPLRSRRIHLYPDCHKTGLAYTQWKARAEELNKEGFSITVDDYEQYASPEHREEGADIADLILDNWEGFPSSWGLASQAPD